MNHALLFDQLVERLTHKLDEDQIRLVNRAYEVAGIAHKDQTRDEGTPYIVHPVRVATTLVAELEIFSPKLICSALMHDVIEDSGTTRQQIAAEFGDEIAEIVWLLTKLEGVRLADYIAAIESATETGAPIVKLCDRLDNLRSLAYTPRVEKKHRYIRTTEAYYLPMAARTNKYIYDELRHSLEQARAHVKDIV